MSEHVQGVESATTYNYSDLIVWLKEDFDVTIKNGEYIEQKAWHVLSLGSTIFAVVTVLQTLRSDGEVGLPFWIGLVIVLLLYAGMVAMVIMAISPGHYYYVPGTPGSDFPVGEWIERYLEADRDHLLRELVSDYVGDGEAKGAIQRNEDVNRKKAKFLLLSIAMLLVTVIGLVGMAVIAVAS